MKAETYFTGRPCKRGHLAERFVSCGICVECNRLHAAQSRIANPEGTRLAVKRAHALYGNRYRAGHSAADKRWKAANPDAVKAYGRRAYEKSDPAYWRAARSKRRAAERCQMPAWADERAIQTIFARCPEGYHVDHAIPLRGRLVSGLHVESNLQYLPASVNRRKHNQFEV